MRRYLAHINANFWKCLWANITPIYWPTCFNKKSIIERNYANHLTPRKERLCASLHQRLKLIKWWCMWSLRRDADQEERHEITVGAGSKRKVISSFYKYQPENKPGNKTVSAGSWCGSCTRAHTWRPPTCSSDGLAQLSGQICIAQAQLQVCVVY